MSEQKIFAAVDGGASKTLAVVVDQAGQELGRGLAGPSNYHGIGLASALANLREAIGAAKAVAGLPVETPLSHLVLGLAGNDRPADRQTWQSALADSKLAGEMEITSDAELILYALPERQGLGVICGTGSIAVGQDGRGNRVRSGGWGYFFGDEGSGLWLGREALQAAARFADGRGAKTLLVELILKDWNLSQPTELIGAVYTAGPVDIARVARLAELVFQAEQAGDDHARVLVREAVNELALALKACDTRLLFRDPPPLAVAGGLLLHHPDFLAALRRRLEAMMTLGPIVMVDDPALMAARTLAQTT